MLEDLKKLKATLLEDIKNVKVETKEEANKDIVITNTDKDVEIAKLNYRILHLTQSLKE